MKHYVLSYESLNPIIKDVDMVSTVLETDPNIKTIVTVQNNLWLLSTALSISEVINALDGIISNSEKLFIAEIKNNFSTKNSGDKFNQALKTLIFD